MIEYLVYASLFTTAVNTYRTLFPANLQQVTPATTYLQHTTPMPPTPPTQYATNTNGNGTNAVFNVAFNNNNTKEPVPTSYESAQNYLKERFDSVHLNDVVNSVYQYCYENKYYIAALSVVSTYGYIFYKIRTIQAYVDNPSTWSAWQKEVPFDRFLAIPQDQLTRDLMMVIQSRYIMPQNPTDFMTPLITFSKEIAQEIELVTRYHNYISWSAALCLEAIVPLSETLLSQLVERKQRITYINTLFQSWLAQYKLEKITK